MQVDSPTAAAAAAAAAATAVVPRPIDVATMEIEQVCDMPIEEVRAVLCTHMHTLTLGKIRSVLRIVIKKAKRPPRRGVRSKCSTSGVPDVTWIPRDVPFAVEALKLIEKMRFPKIGIPGRGYSMKLCSRALCDDHLSNVDEKTRMQRLMLISTLFARLVDDAKPNVVEGTVIVMHSAREGHGLLKGSGVALDDAGATALRSAATTMLHRLEAVSDGCSSDSPSESTEEEDSTP